METIADARVRVQKCFDSVLDLVTAADVATVEALEERAWPQLMETGRAVVRLFLALRAHRPRPANYEHAGERWRLAEPRTDDVGTLFGKVPFERRVGRLYSSARARADLPVDRDLGLAGGFTSSVVCGIARLCAQMPFGAARQQWKSTYGWAPAPRAVLRMVDAVGERVTDFVAAAQAPEDDGDVLVIQVDAGGAPMIDEIELARRRQPKRTGDETRSERRARRAAAAPPRRTKGKKSKNAKQAFTAVLYTLRRGPDGSFEGPINKHVMATFESHAALFKQLEPEARKRGYGSKTTLFLADGAEHIQRLQTKHFPAALPCLDWYHMAEYLWKAAHCIHNEGSPEAAAWVRKQKDRMANDQIEAVIAEMTAELATIPKKGPGNKGRRDRLESASEYLDKRRSQMPYAAFRAAGYDIGSGAVEGAIRNLVRMRLDGPGTRWGRHRAEAVLRLRCILISHRWQQFRDHLRSRPPVRLAAQPLPAIPHAAKAAA
jgi:hypothetical protein